MRIIYRTINKTAMNDYGRFYRLYTETTTGGKAREAYRKEGGATGDVFSFEYEITKEDDYS